LRWRHRAVIAITAIAVTALGHLLWPDLIHSDAVHGAAFGALFMVVALEVRVGRRHVDKVPQVVTEDLGTLRDCFSVLQKQVGVTIQTSETAVLEMVTRLQRVHTQAETLRQQIIEAVNRSQALSQQSASEAGRHGSAVRTLADHQAAFDAARVRNQERIRSVVHRVRQLTPLTELITDISRQTNLLSLNASIEAARAGPEGAGFKVVAAEVRRLSGQTTEAAHNISEGIRAVADAIDRELVTAATLEAENTATQLNDIAQYIGHMTETIGEVVPYLGQLSSTMEDGMRSVTLDLLDTLGQMQFQDINRQLLEQVDSALHSLSHHCAELYDLVGGKAPPPPRQLEDLLQRWVAGYVMHEQRMAHAAVRGEAELGDPSPAKTAPAGGHKPSETPHAEPELATAQGPRIELF